MAKSMSGQLRMFDRTTSEGSSSATGSPGSAGGVTPSDWPGGPTPDPSGPGVAPASRSQVRAPKLAGMIRATFGRSGFSSSASAALTSSLVNRLKRRLDTAGSIVFAMTWSQKATPSGRVVSRLRVSARSTSGNGYGSWPTPNTPSGGRSVDPSQMSATGVTRDGRKHTVSLEHVARFASWPTQKQSDSDKGVRTMRGAQKELERKGLGADLPTLAAAAGWAMPVVRDHRNLAGDGTNPCDLPRQVSMLQAGWQTPTAQNARHGSMSPSELRRHDPNELHRQVYLTSGQTATGSPAPMEKRGQSHQLNPMFSLWLMGFGIEWLMCAQRSLRKAQKP